MYSGIEINEGKLLANNVVFTLILLFLIAVGIVAFFVFRDDEGQKERTRMRRLKARADTDQSVKKRFEALARKRRKRTRNAVAERVLVFSLLTGCILIDLFVSVIPGWTDYIKKDYIVYGADAVVSYEVHGYIRSSTITLSDSTVLSGGFGLEEGIHHGTVVYARRTKIVIGVDGSPDC